MSERDWKILFEDILESTDKISRYIENLSFDGFSVQQIVIDAVVRNLEIIGEASSRVPEDIQKRFPEIPWRKIIGLRNRIIHEYFGVDLTIIWYIVNNEMPNLKAKIVKAINS